MMRRKEVLVLHVRIGNREFRAPESRWEALVSEGAIPPQALVFSLTLTGGLWKRADSLELYAFFRNVGEEERREEDLPQAGHVPFSDLMSVAFPSRGFSMTETLLTANLLVALLLVFLWGAEAYTHRLFGDLTAATTLGRGLAWDFYRLWQDQRIPVGFVATIFIHADIRHLMANMATLAPAAAFVEYLYGRRRAALFYLATGVAGAILSYAFKGRGPMSVGASGAIYGLIGVLVGYVVRHYQRLPRWHRWRARRIWVPLLALGTLPSIFNADWRAHVGGFLSGLVLGLVLSAGRRSRAFLLPEEAGRSRESRRA